MSLADAVETALPAALDDLAEFVAIPSVSASPDHAQDVQRSARWVHNQLTALGCADARIVSEGGQPAVIARFPGPPGAPTICLYAHHDVQPTGDVTLWTSENPFAVREANGRLFARGVGDDKAGVLVHLTALRAFGGGRPWAWWCSSRAKKRSVHRRWPRSSLDTATNSPPTCT